MEDPGAFSFPRCLDLSPRHVTILAMGKKTTSPGQQILEMLEPCPKCGQVRSVSSIATELGISRQRVYQVRDRMILRVLRSEDRLRKNGGKRG